MGTNKGMTVHNRSRSLVALRARSFQSTENNRRSVCCSLVRLDGADAKTDCVATDFGHLAHRAGLAVEVGCVRCAAEGALRLRLAAVQRNEGLRADHERIVLVVVELNHGDASQLVKHENTWKALVLSLSATASILRICVAISGFGPESHRYAVTLFEVA